MDAVEFLVERKRLCSSYKGCMGCPFGAAECVVRDMTSEHTCKRIVAAVENWSKEHPRKTRQSVFLEKYPETLTDGNGVLDICPAVIYLAYRGDEGRCSGLFEMCDKCRREFWMQEVD